MTFRGQFCRHGTEVINSMRRGQKRRFLPVLALILVCLCGCGDGGEAPGPQPADKEQAGGASAPSDKKPTGSGEYKAPAFADASFHEDQAQGTEQAKIDVSAVSQGYVAVSAKSDKRLKFRAVIGDVKYNYDVYNDGTPCIFPLQSGNGTYTFEVLEQVAESSYASLYSMQCEVALQDEFQPFLRPSEYSKYGEESECVKKASELASSQDDELGVVSAVFDDICGSISYDMEKAAAVAGATGYMPNPDETLQTKKGICFDYAALAAAMLRSQGIPTKIVFGYVSPGDLYHAWNMFYTDKDGWVSVGYDVKAGDWYRMDTTFSAGGASDSFAGDGENYVDAKYY